MRFRSGLTVIPMLFPITAWAQKVETQYDRSVDFKEYKTYMWGERKFETLQSKDGNYLIDRVLVGAVNAQLKAKGFTEITDSPDFIVTF